MTIDLLTQRSLLQTIASAKQAGNILGQLQAWDKLRRSKTTVSIELGREFGFASEADWQSAYSQALQMRAQFIRDTYATIRAVNGARALFRIDRAVSGYLGEAAVFSSQPTQQPKFLYIPGLPDIGFHVAAEHPCAAPLLAAAQDMRAEFLQLQQETFLPYMKLPAGTSMEQFVGGPNPKSSWDAVFFYRHGERFKTTHEQCPKTSHALESLPLVRLQNQTPEICFSVMQPETTIKAHHGTCNARLVLHIPLVVPQGCYLDLLGVGKQHWEQGKALLFDDTFLHCAYNPTMSQRVILLMDVWNHHLRDFEIEAFSALVAAISAIEQSSVINE